MSRGVPGSVSPGGFLAGHDRNPARSLSPRTACPAAGSSGPCCCRLFRFLVQASVMTAHMLPPAAIHRHALASWGPRAKTKAARVHTVIAALTITTQDSNRIRILIGQLPPGARMAQVPGLARLASRGHDRTRPAAVKVAAPRCICELRGCTTVYHFGRLLAERVEPREGRA
jgi:hypothetical protein